MGDTDKTSSSYCAVVYIARWKMPRATWGAEQGHLTEPGGGGVGGRAVRCIVGFSCVESQQCVDVGQAIRAGKACTRQSRGDKRRRVW